MFLSMCHEGEIAVLPSGAYCRILGMGLRLSVRVQRLDDAEEFEIKPCHLRHACDAPAVEVGALVMTVARREVLAEVARLRADDTHY